MRDFDKGTRCGQDNKRLRRGKPMRELYEVFKDKETGQELARYTIRGTFNGEREATISLLAYENGIPADQIEVLRELR